MNTFFLLISSLPSICRYSCLVAITDIPFGFQSVRSKLSSMFSQRPQNPGAISTSSSISRVRKRDYIFDDDDEDTGGESSNSMVDTNFKIPVVF